MAPHMLDFSALKLASRATCFPRTPAGNLSVPLVYSLPKRHDNGSSSNVGATRVVRLSTRARAERHHHGRWWECSCEGWRRARREWERDTEAEGEALA